MKTILQFLQKSLPVLIILGLITNSHAQKEFSFKNAVLVSGSPNKDGAVYKFKNVASGVDANVTIVGRSGPEVILDTIDMPPAGGMGYDKAFQPQLGMHGTTPANSNWWMKFKVNFLKAGTSTAQTMTNFVTSAVDIDGDNQTISENVKMFQTAGVKTSISSVLSIPAILPLTCPKCSKISTSKDCADCGGLGYTTKSNGKIQDCGTCNNTGKVFVLCNHAWTGSDIQVSGTILNAVGIDTLALNNIASFTYANTDQVVFSYGGTTGLLSSTAGERLNSMWFKSVNITTASLLAVNLTDFSATAQNSAVNLKWTASADKDFNQFVVERSTDGISFRQCAIVLGADNAGAAANYTYKDQLAENIAGIIYYRLKMIDESAAVTYSAVKTINLNTVQSNTVISAYPNPASSQLHVTMPQAWYGKKAVAEIYNPAGIMIKSLPLNSVNQTESLDMSQLTRGLYTVNLICLNNRISTKVLKN